MISIKSETNVATSHGLRHECFMSFVKNSAAVVFQNSLDDLLGTILATFPDNNENAMT